MNTRQEAEKIVEMFKPYADMWNCYYDIPSTEKNDVKIATKHVEGILEVLNNEIRDIDVRGSILLDLIRDKRLILKELKSM